LSDEGAMRCWGSEDVSLPGVFKAIAYGCGLREDDTVTCREPSSPSPGYVGPPSGSFVGVAGDGGITCGLRPSGSITCWGGLDLWPGGPQGAEDFVNLGSNEGGDTDDRGDEVGEMGDALPAVELGF
jgi:hypothetical protein